MKDTLSPVYLILAATFCVCLIISNLLEVKVINICGMTLTAGIVVFPISYIINDCVVETYGLRRAQLMIWLGFGMNLLVTLLLQLGLWLPADPAFDGQEALERVFGAVPRILLASFTAFLAGSMVNARVMALMHRRDGNRRFSLRAVVSTLLGEGTDSLIFFPIAFGGVLPWPAVWGLVLTQTLLKTAYEIAILPITVQAVKRLKRLERHNLS